MSGSDASDLQQLLRESGAQISMSKCDTSFSEDATATVNAAAGRQVGGAGISGVLLAGGVLNDAMLSSQTAGRWTGLRRSGILSAWTVYWYR